MFLTWSELNTHGPFKLHLAGQFDQFDSNMSESKVKVAENCNIISQFPVYQFMWNHDL